ncbi:hypothetical protein BV25DRAFT_1050293 [Artomyces pyxidatus]|uniref:Uncharacterized protein n=1 Tax=Artomyces pyxidatus TaxID=48021 RepID=A0ACB8STP4_9AGAM|nr:hypothetical protein BV25DRAFT_1050293 [Artomyces pyxidatus]
MGMSRLDTFLYLHSQAIIPTGRPSLSNRSLLFLSLCLLLCGFALSTCALRSRRRGIRVGYESLQALQSVVVPSQSRWPASFAALASTAHRSPDKTLWIPLTTFLDDLLRGAVELRHPARDLPFLVRTGVLINGWRVRIYVDLASRRKSALWVSVPRIFPRFQLKSLLDVEQYLLDLDFVPPAKLSSTIRHYLRTASSIQHTVSLLLTTKDPSVSFLDPAFALVALPFLPRRSSLNTRTTTAFVTSLSTILGLLSDAAATVVSVENTSTSYADALFRASETMKNEPPVRTSFVKQRGTEGWREECLCGQWEAALLQAGLLTKWRITVRK